MERPELFERFRKDMGMTGEQFDKWVAEQVNRFFEKHPVEKETK